MAQPGDRFGVQVVRDGAGHKVRVTFRGRVVRTLHAGRSVFEA